MRDTNLSRVSHLKFWKNVNFIKFQENKKGFLRFSGKFFMIFYFEKLIFGEYFKTIKRFPKL